MKRALFVAALAAFPMLEACVSVHTHPLSVSATDGRALFSSIATCAADRRLEAVTNPDSVNVRTGPGVWTQFMAQGSQFNLVIVLDDQSGGQHAVEERATIAKKKGDEIFACAVAAGPKPGTTVPADPGATTPDIAAAPAPISGGEPATTPAAKSPMDGFGKALGGGFDAMGKGLSTMSDCTKLTACRTHLSGDVCLGADKACLDAINGGDSGGPAACGKNLERVRAAAERFKKRPDWQMPPECM